MTLLHLDGMVERGRITNWWPFWSLGALCSTRSWLSLSTLVANWSGGSIWPLEVRREG